MTMQYDVKQAHLNQSGLMVNQRTRVKAIAFVGTSNAGQFVIFDTLTAPVSSGVTYGRSGTTITVSKRRMV
jgi:GTP-binding protein EngB required for normal cell division